MAPDGAVRFKQGDDLEISGKLTDLRGGSRRTDQEVFVGAIDFAEGPYNVPRVGAYSEFGRTPDVNRDLHG